MEKNIVIIGAGIAGLTLASKLAKQGIKTVIIECEKHIGGLAYSYKYDNGAIFDIGPHRFHTDDSQVQQFIEETLADNVITIDRNSQLFLFGKYLPWPITLKNVLSLPPTMLVKSAIDLLLPKKAQNESLRDYIIEKYGKTLFEVFFRPYSEKFLDYTCSNLHRDWAKAGINRANIDKQVQTSSLMSLIKSVIFSKNPDTKFLYPKTGGIGAFCEKLADKVIQNEGRILLDTRVDRFATKNGAITTIITDQGEEIPADYVFWSGSLQDLHTVGKMPESVPQMHYISTILFNYLVSSHIPQGFQWCYFGDEDMEVDRISVPRNFNPNTVPKGKEALCIEITCEESSPFWQDPSRADCKVETFMLHANLINSLDCIEDVHIEKVRRTYPLYTLNYPRKLRATFEWVEAAWKNLALLGRTGRFWYNNMDHSIAASLQTAERFIEDYQKGTLQKNTRYSVEDRYFGEDSH